MLDDLPIRHAHDVNQVDLDLAAGRLDTLEQPQMRTGKHLAGDNLVALYYLVQDDDAQVGERGRSPSNC